ncbi:hypothetical protein KPC_0460 [Acinetobacter stercoris]|uniref:Metalloprotease StcE beta-sandwich domain-containing protein n=2 Tax=Acinetobacter stercoris TaxID=2126983 RepID=A0A2U3MV35_9GAMM|nr:metalloendopeptidase CpaA [Acinetobacter stercoris]SPL69282.1 hypothetical protein KPC_0460 [Acinetobacter stercoris]
MKKKLAVFLSACVVGTVFASTVLTPNTNNKSGDIPTGYTELDFNLFNGNWVENLTLPKTASDKAVVKITSDAGYASYLDTSNTDIPLESLKITKGSSYTFIFDLAQKKWNLDVQAVALTNGVDHYTVPGSEQYIQKVQLKNGQWAKQISLPAQAKDGSLIQVVSSASNESSINTDNLLFSSSFILKNGDEFWFKYNEKLEKWVSEYVKPHQLNAQQVGKNIPSVKAPVTEILFANGNWVAEIVLPKTAKDRDRIVFKSTAAWQAKISNENTSTSSTLKLKNGDRYEFLYVADIAKWVLISSPQLTLQAKDLASRQIPNMEQPTTRIKVANANWQPSLNLPLVAQVGDKVIFNSTANYQTNITSANGINDTLSKEESLRYKYTATGWTKDSSTIDILLVNSPEVTTKLDGASAAKLRMIESYDLTNSSAEASDAQFYLRNVSYLEYKIPSTTRLLDVISTGRDDKTVQNERDRVKADAIYYQGNESDPAACGWAWVNKTPSAYNMISSSTLQGCSIGAMRHEVGHNLGLNHTAENYVGQGFSHPLGSTIMNGNSLDFYSSPTLYSPQYGIRLGEAGKIDAVSIINKNAPLVARFK